MANDQNKKKYIEYEDTRYELVDGEARARIAVLEQSGSGDGKNYGIVVDGTMEHVLELKSEALQSLRGIEQEIAALPQYRPGVNAAAASYSNLLSNCTTDGTFLALAANWNDLPGSDGYVVTNAKYSNYTLQTAVSVASGRVYNRVVHTANHTVFRDWLPAADYRDLRILAVGDSICSGFRNGGKGFVGDLGMPYRNEAVAGSALSNVIPDKTSIPDQLVGVSNYSPDIIIADGGVNDYYFGAPLGAIPTAPVTTDAEANALDRSSVMGGLQYLLYQMVSRYPEAQRFFVIPHKIFAAASGQSSTPVYWPAARGAGGYTQQELHDAIAACCDVYNVHVIDVYRDGMINTAFGQYRSAVAYADDSSVTDTEYVDADGLHPLARGYLQGYVPLVREAIRIGTAKEA